MSRIGDIDWLRAIGDEYYTKCNQYRLSVCSGRTNEGVPIPVNKNELVKVSTYSSKTFRWSCRKYQLSNQQMMKALRYSRRDKDA